MRRRRYATCGSSGLRGGRGADGFYRHLIGETLGDQGSFKVLRMLRVALLCPALCIRAVYFALGFTLL